MTPLRLSRWAALLSLLVLMLPVDAQPARVAYPGERVLRVSTGETKELALPELEVAQLYGVLVYLPDLAVLGTEDQLTVTVMDAAGKGVTKTLHAGDADCYVTIRSTAAGPGHVRAQAAARSGSGKVYALQCVASRLGVDAAEQARLAEVPTASWTNAPVIKLGETVFGSNDERPYVPRLGDPSAALEDLVAGAQWFQFTWEGPGAKLVHFTVDVLDRDVPMDVALFRPSQGKSEVSLAPYLEGLERYNTEQSTKFHGLQKFIARLVQPGTYYVRVMGNHPDYALRTVVYNPPPYDDPEAAVRVALDYLLRKGDSWHANTPRRGSVALRTSNRLAETAQCIACHPTHFTTRAVLIGLENGWSLGERPGLQFLTERLYNNPRPLYGMEEGAWARMISAPGNVLSRVGYMVSTYERLMGLEARPGLLTSIGGFLEAYWDGVGSPITESNGNSPRVSGFEVALHSGLVFTELHRRTGLDKYIKLRQQVEQVAAAGVPGDMIDLCWKIAALCEFNRDRFAPQIAEGVNQLFFHQKVDGTWSVAFDQPIEQLDSGSRRPEVPRDAQGAPIGSEFQTYHALYALAKAGVAADDPRIAPSLRWCLSRQWSHGGWQGNTDFKNFDTVFRDTQYAVMALSEFCQGPGPAGWNVAPANRENETTTSHETVVLLQELSQIWERPGPVRLDNIQKLLAHGQPLVRAAAAATLGRVADDSAPAALLPALGDGSKLVQRAAAWALRQIISRRGAGQEALLQALASSDDRTRWGALRVFNQHFRYLAPDWRFGEALLQAARHDPVAFHRMAALQALWQWWAWDGAEEHRAAIEDLFIDQMSVVEHPWVRRNLVEGLHNLLDENVRYLYNDWIPALKAEDTRQRVKSAHRATAARQAAKLAAALQRGNSHQVDGLLRSFYAFHLRESTVELSPSVAQFQFPPTYVVLNPTERGENSWLEGYKFAASYDPSTQGLGLLGRIGNDTEPPTFYEDSGPVLADALERTLESSSPDVALAVLKTLRSSKGVPLNGRFSAQLLALASSPETRSNALARELVRDVLPARFTAAPESVAALAGVIRRGTGEALRLAATVLRGAPDRKLVEDATLLEAVQARLSRPDTEADRASLLDVLLSTLELQPRRAVREWVMAVSRDGSDTLRRQALRTLFQGERFLTGTRARREFESDLDEADAARLQDWLAAAAALDWKALKGEGSTQLVLGTVTTALVHSDGGVRQAGLEAIRSIPFLGKNPAVRESVRLLRQDPEAVVAERASALLPSLEPRTAGSPALPTPEYDFFVEHVQPIFQRVASDGDSCARCHANHSILRLIPGSDQQPLGEEQLRFNYLSALKVVNLEQPEESLLLIKPRSSFEGIGQPEKYRQTHGGDVRWPAGTQSAEYDLILRWIRGERSPLSADRR